MNILPSIASLSSHAKTYTEYVVFWITTCSFLEGNFI